MVCCDRCGGGGGNNWNRDGRIPGPEEEECRQIRPGE